MKKSTLNGKNRAMNLENQLLGGMRNRVRRFPNRRKTRGSETLPEVSYCVPTNIYFQNARK